MGDQSINIDNNIPATPRQQPQSQQLEPDVDLTIPSERHPILLQAFAKQHGSYDAISGGHVCDAFEALTGAPTETVTLGGSSVIEPAFGETSWCPYR